MQDTIVIVDDSPTYQDILGTVVEALGYRAVICADGSDAIRYLGGRAASVAAVLMDIYMPEIDGISALGHLRTQYPEIPFVMITGSEDASDRQAAEGLGIAGFITKPFAVEELQETLQELLNKPGERKALA